MSNGGVRGGPTSSEAASGGDAAGESALAEIYRDHGGAVYGLARYLCGPELAEEVTHRVFVRWWQGGGSADRSERAVRTTLLTSAREQARELLQSGPPGSRRATDPALYAVEWLPEMERDAIATALLGQCTYREAAAVLGQPVASVRALIRAGLGRLRSIGGPEPAAT